MKNLHCNFNVRANCEKRAQCGFQYSLLLKRFHFGNYLSVLGRTAGPWS